MSRARHAALIRTIAAICLLWATLDLGAHGFLASEPPPLAAPAGSVRLVPASIAPTTDPSADHCFCHCFSTGAVLLPLCADLVAVGTLAAVLPRQLPHVDSNPLERPPQPIA